MIRKLDLLYGKYQINNTFQEEKSKFYQEIRNECKTNKYLNQWLVKINFLKNEIECEKKGVKESINFRSIENEEESLKISFGYYEEYLDECSKRTDEENNKIINANKEIYKLLRKSKSRINEEEEIIIVNNNDIINDGDNNEDMIVKELTEIKNNYEEVTEKLEENQMEEYNDNEIHSKIFIDQFLNDPNSFKKQNNLINNNIFQKNIQAK